ncbi:MAG: diguanylate cyclase [Sphingobium sp.]|nr:MAG: diguanylate cyclase [Sphingobium sp.]
MGERGKRKLTVRNDRGEDGGTLFILSPTDRDGLAALAGGIGWRPMAARRVEGAERRFLASDAQVMLVDLREDAVSAKHISPLGEAVAASGGALIVLVAAGRESDVPALIASGATHFLADPVTAPALSAVLASARALIGRIGGGLVEGGHRHAIRRNDALFWRLDRHSGLVIPSAELARLLAVEGEAHRPSALLRAMAPRDRVSALRAVRAATLRGSGAFAHDMAGPPSRRAAHHLYVEDDAVVGEVELIAPGQEVLPRSARRDSLTGLADRTGAVEWIGAALEDGRAPALLLLSISDLSGANAAYGQIVVDALIGRLARRMERLVEELGGGDALIARIGGAEFLIGLPGEQDVPVRADRATFLARRLVSVIGQPFNAGDHLIRLTGRCGIAEGHDGDDVVRLLRRAASALADARQSDGEGIRIYAARHSREVDADRLEADLRLALDRGEIGIVFQPQYDVADDAVVGVEALARWDHPDHGPLGAAVLFATAERSDFLLPLSRHIHAEALRLAASWPAALSDLRLSINVTSADIAQPEFVGDFLGLIAASGFPRDRVTVEITESGLIDDLTAAAGLMDQLRVAGLRIAIDDFGTGYSSLAYLKALPLDYLKIDSGLAQDIAGSPRDRVVVQSVIQMARSLGLRVIAEGVETEQQRALLAHEGCHYYQGFLRAPPLSSDALVERLTSAGSR